MSNTIVRSIAPKSLFEDAKSATSSSVSYLQGDLLVFNTTSHTIVKPAAETEGNLFLGVARVSVVNGKVVSPYVTDVDGSVSIADIPGPVYGVEAKVILATGSTLNCGGLVYLAPGTSTRGVAATGTKAIGMYNGPAIASSAAGLEIVILVGARHPSDSLIF